MTGQIISMVINHVMGYTIAYQIYFLQVMVPLKLTKLYLTSLLMMQKPHLLRQVDKNILFCKKKKNQIKLAKLFMKRIFFL